MYSIGQDSLRVMKLNSYKVDLEKSIKVLSDSLMKIKHEISMIEAKNKMNAKDQEGIPAYCSAGTKIRPNPTPVAPILVTVDNGDSIKVIDFYDGYYGVKYDSIYGYINEMWVVTSDELRKLKEDKIQEKKRNEEVEEWREKLKVERQNEVFVEKSKKRYGVVIYNRIKNGEYWLGMTEDMAILSLGRPEKINRSVGRWGIREQWVFDKLNRLYLYFENGILVSYQN